MLNLLHIENIAVIEKADVEFTPGLNVLTGETGAGKSIVIDALTAVTGGRLSRDTVRTGAKNAVVTAVFDDTFSDEWYQDSGIERDEDGQLFITRKITPEGKNSCRINGTPVSVVQLRQLCGGLVDIHGQNDGRKLLDEAFHLKYLDGFAETMRRLKITPRHMRRLRARGKSLNALLWIPLKLRERPICLSFRLRNFSGRR